ncbi:putative rhamnogalacturonate lyase B-like [Dorcoceras hygrometricum]|uniref:rhamnogalacturonan endolyase n=1 Tax=Dorcoceras hygrometricum TaxID=472368 RepID=A0A2Z7CSK3_9LAMI|nr:putative rhamnogalacturonate lyase B-like [Dorcoceras hygrometricum]
MVVLNNGIVSVTFSMVGHVTSLMYEGSTENLLESQNAEDDRGYWSVVWNKPEEKGGMERLQGTSYRVILQNPDQTEISFSTTWTVGSEKVPLNFDKRFVMLRGVPGFYTYTVLEKQKGWPAFDIQIARVVFKLDENKFHYMAMSDERKRFMPMEVDRKTGQVLEYKEAVLLTNPTNPQFKGEVDDKYLYSCDNKDNKVHGWVSTDLGLGVWMITPSIEFKTGGPLKQDLTSHVGPTMLSIFISPHYAGEDLALKFEEQEYWKKVLGPVFVYLNSDVSAKTNPSVLWDEAKQRMSKEVASWPYDFPFSNDFLNSSQRGAVSGQLLVHDSYINKQPVPAASAYIGLAPTEGPGSWQTESKGYQFWTQTDDSGNFLIKNVIPGTYSLFAWVRGTVGDYKHATDIIVASGSNIELHDAVFNAPRFGPTLWEIGIPDRTAAEFFIPDPVYKIHQYQNYTERFRQYGLWARYAESYPESDLLYTVGESDYKTDWFFAHVTRHGIHGLYHFYSIGIAGSRLVDGMNTIFLTQDVNLGPFREVMYDYIRLEGPAS